jgi:serine protease
MRRSLALLGTLGVLGISGAARAAPVPNEIVIDLRDDTTDQDERELEAMLGGLDLRLNSVHAEDERIFIAETSATGMESLLSRIEGDPRIESAEPNYYYEALLVPNDPKWEAQWSFRMVDAPNAWELATGKGVTVAVIDTGVAYENHKRFRTVEDLRGTGFVKGYDFVNDSDHANDDHGHGTHVAGTIAQTTNNGVGVAGLAHEAKIMPLKVLNKSGFGTAADIADAIRFAADEGAQVINMSLGGGPRSLVMQSAVAYARKKGLVVVCAAGNTGRGRVEYPAAYPGSFAISSVGPTKELAFYSSYGKEIAVAAPGGDKRKGDQGGILQNTIEPRKVDQTDGYLYFQGTSMAAPHAAGIAALVLSAGVTDASDVERILKETAADAGAKGWDERYGHGIVNAGAAVKAAKDATSGFAHFGVAMLGLGAFLFRNRRRLSPATMGLAFLGAVAGGSGLFFLDVPVISTAMPAWTLGLGAAWHFAAPWVSFLPLFILSVVALGVRSMRGLLMGLAIGWASYLFLSGLTMPADVLFVPGHAGLLDRLWLLVNGGVLVALAGVFAAVHARRAV